MNEESKSKIDDLVERLYQFRKTEDARLLAIGMLMIGFDTLARLRAANVWTTHQIVEVVAGIMSDFDVNMNAAEHGALKTALQFMNDTEPHGKPN